MTYQPPTERRERILLFGVQGVGKSEAVLSIAKRCSPSPIHVIDTEMAYSALLTDETNVVYHPVLLDDWVELMQGVAAARKVATKDSWLVIDSMSSSWDAIQAHALDNDWTDKERGGVDWLRINREHIKLYRAILSWPGHVLMTARSKELALPKPSGKGGESKQVMTVFGMYGVKPAGQKDIGHIPPHTVILLTKSRVGEFQMTTVKDRKRKEVENQPVRDFARDYLMKLGGWKNDAVADTMETEGEA